MSDAGEIIARVKPLVGILAGAILGGAVYAVSRGLLPDRLAFGAAVVGVLAGLGARLGGAIGSPAQLRVLIFSVLLAALLGEFVIYRGGDEDLPFARYLVERPAWLVFTVFFITGGIFFGVRLLVGGNPLDDVLTHGASAIPPGATGTPCPRCESVQTRLDPTTLDLCCNQCGHVWRPGAA